MNLKLFAALVALGTMLPHGGQAFSPMSRPQGSSYRSSRTSNTPSPSLASSRIEDLPGPDTVTEESIRSLFYLWNNALATGESRLVAKRYAKDAVLLPAASDEPHMDNDSIKQYYDEFLKKMPQKEVIQGRIRIGHGWAEDAGICEISLKGEENKKIRARYSFVYVWEDRRWKILHHHSSVMPQDDMQPRLKGVSDTASLPSRPRMTKERVQSLFQLFHDALETLDAKAVAQCFSKSAVVFPTDSQQLLSSPVEINNYLKDFLKKQPQIQILNSHISIGADNNSAKNMGTYSLTFGTDPSKKIVCRYSFDYALESDGQWRITHYQATPIHGSSLPVEVLSPERLEVERMYAVSNNVNEMTEDDVRALFQKWNEALRTKSSEEVAKRYAQKAVLVPTTTSDTPRTSPQAIKEFYEFFLLSQPQVKQVQSFVTVQNHWCKDVGVLEYTLGNPEMGQERRTVKERYSLLYVWEGGEWKIAYHHSSVFAEALKTSVDRAAGIEPGDKGDRPSGGQDQKTWM